MTSGLSLRCIGFGLALCCTAPLRAQPSAAEQATQPTRATALSLVTRVAGTGIDAEALRAALASELGVPVERVAAGERAHLVIEASTLTALRVMFVRDDGSSLERTLDVSSLGDQAAEAAALVAANLMRDEATEVLAALHATPPVPANAPPASANATLADKPSVIARQPALKLARPVLPRGCDRNELRHVAFGADFVPYVGMSSAQGPGVERGISLNLIGGMTGATRGFELAGVFNLDMHNSCGFQLSGVANINDGPTQGVQVSEINFTHGRLDGVQLGLIGVATADISGAQLGLVNLGAAELEGVQLGLVNLAKRRVHGAQLGLVNVDGGELQGAQLGLVNVAGSARAAQLALVNVGAGAAEGAQIGLVNVRSGEVHGLQLGLVNVAENADAAIGLVSVLTRGRTQLDIWGTDANLIMVGVKHGGRRIHNIYGFGVRAESHPILAGALGLGVRALTLPLPKSWRVGPLFVDIDAIGYYMLQYQSANRFENASIIQLRAPLGLQIASWLSVFASPALNLSLVDATNTQLTDPLQLGGVRLTARDVRLGARLGPGFNVGIRLF